MKTQVDHDAGFCKGLDECDICHDIWVRYAHKASVEADNICASCGGNGAFILDERLICAPCLGDEMNECMP